MAEKAYLPEPPIVSHAADFQEDAAAGWDPQSCRDCESPEFMLLVTGALPAGIISSLIRSGDERFWDPGWFLILEALPSPLGS